MDDIIQELKNSPKASGHDRIYVAGEKEFEIAEYNTKHGIPILKKVVEELKESGAKLGVPFTIAPIN